ncbi:MAG: guanylate kinase [Planctomycetota bacterium]|nr:guanylate kinase [Planctomycetota bacterium]
MSDAEATSGAPQDGQRLVVVSGASGAGKTSVAHRLLLDERFGRAVTATTREPREGEQDGVDYHFLTAGEFHKRLIASAFLAPAEVYGHWYGTPRENVEAILASGRHCILVIDVQGVEDLQGSDVEALYVFVDAPSFEELQQRLRGRGDEDPDKISARLRAARSELDKKDLFDRVLVNDDIDRAARELAGWLGLELA